MQITLEEIKNYLKVEHNEDDALIDSMILAAVKHCEAFLGRPLSEQNMTQEEMWTVPETVKLAVLMLVAHWYENRGVVLNKTTGEIAYSVSALLWPYRRIAF